MAKITYIGDGTVEWFGIPFLPNRPVDLDATRLTAGQKVAILAKARGNPYFDAAGDGLPDEGQDDAPGDGAADAFGPFKVRHKGRGRYIVGRDGVVLAENLTKDEARTHARDLYEAELAAQA